MTNRKYMIPSLAIIKIRGGKEPQSKQGGVSQGPKEGTMTERQERLSTHNAP